MSLFCRLGRTLLRSVFKHHVEVKGSSKVAARSSGGTTAGQNNRAAQQLQAVSAYTRCLQGTVPSLCHGLLGGILGRAFTGSLQFSLLRGQTVLHLMKGCGPRAPMFAFLGFVYTSFNVKPASEVQLEKNKLQQLQNWVQEALKTSEHKVNEESSECSHSGLRLKDYQLGERLGQKSANAAVYAARYEDKEFAMKMLFNYHTSSQSTALYKEFAKEYTVVSTQHETSLPDLPDSTHSWVPPHPNIVPILHRFADQVPCLPGAQDSYPAALPTRYSRCGLGRNRTLFLVMPRLNRTVREYVNTDPVSPGVASLLLTQLLEGIAHCSYHEVAHRDLKTDNLLLDESCQPCPRLLITDFGCCLADKRWGLKLPFLTEETDRGGNPLLMSPEVVNAHAAEDSVIDYSKSDAWAAGAIAYELFGQMNPFYNLNSASYSEDQLPVLSNASPWVRRVVSLLLRREPSERITADQAAAMMHLILWAPSRWLESPTSRPDVCDVITWLIGSCLQVVSPENSVIERQLLRMFVSRTAAVDDVMEALDLFYE